VILYELESTRYATLVLFFQDYMLGYEDHFDREYIWRCYRRQRSVLTQEDKLAIYLTGNYDALHVL